MIKKYALYSLENVDSVTLVNYNYEVDENAFQYGEFTTVNIIGGNPIINKSAFSSCEDLVSISFSDCNIQADEYAFIAVKISPMLRYAKIKKRIMRLKLMTVHFSIVKGWKQ